MELRTRTLETAQQVGTESRDRFFSNQDTMPKGGFGSLIALPLQKAPRESGCVEFLDDDLRPYSDRWRFLATNRRMSQPTAERFISEDLQHGDLIGVFSRTDTPNVPVRRV